MSTMIHWHPRYSVQIALAEDGETQKELAGRIGWDVSKLSRIISGKTQGSLTDWMDIARGQGRDITFYVAPTIDLRKGVYVNSFSRPLLKAA